jgi:hypothetical protein
VYGNAEARGSTQRQRWLGVSDGQWGGRLRPKSTGQMLEEAGATSAAGQVNESSSPTFFTW